MLKNVSNLGTSLTKEQQKTINGGYNIPCRTNRDCWQADPYAGPGDYSCRYAPFGYGRICVAN